MRYRIRGKVLRGAKRGRDLGFPTANIRLHKTISEGIYISLVRLNKNTYPALAFIGSAKTFGESEVKAEIYMLDFDQNLYGKFISVQLLKKIRENEKFEGSEKLVEQMKEDEKVAREYFKR